MNYYRFNPPETPMKRLFFALFAFVLFLVSAAAQDLTCFELRTYHAAPGKAVAMHARFRYHTVALFEKHGMTNILYGTTRTESGEKGGNTLIYLLGYPDKTAREASWKAFLEDPEWSAVKSASEKDGKLVGGMESLFLHLTDYSPAPPIAAASGPRIIEMRRYTTLPGKLDSLDARFRDHTVKLFAKHGMTNLPYFHLDEGQDGNDVTLLYFLTHTSTDAMTTSFDSFRGDPDWITVRDASEKDGRILIEKGVVSTALDPTEYSPVK